MSKAHRPFLLLTSALYIFFVATQLVQDGMFTDGLQYVCVAKNLALGKGTFWNPTFSETFFPSFHQQPPLFMFIESLFFRALGTGLHVERVYCLVVLLITIFLIVRIWKTLFIDNEELQKFYWLPLLFFIASPWVGWTYSNNVVEGTMSIFDLLAVYFAIKSLQQSSFNLVTLGMLLTSGIAIFLASFCKGFQGVFPLVAVLCYWLAMRRISLLKSLAFTAMLLALPLMIYGLILLDDTAVQSFKDYFDARLYSTFNHAGAATTGSRFRLLWRLSLALLPMAALTSTVVLLLKRFIPQTSTVTFQSEATWMLLIGISGSLPLMVTLEQRNFYMTTALPYYAFAFALVAAPYLADLFKKWQVHTQSIKLLQRAMAILLLASIITTAFLFGNIRRDKALLTDIYSFGKTIPEKSIVKVTPSIWVNWSMHGYFMRHYQVSLYSGDGLYPYFIMEKGSASPKGYTMVEQGSIMELYKSNEN